LPFFCGFGILILEYGEKGMLCSWHTLLAQNVLVAVLAKGNARFLQSAKVTVNTLSMQNFVLIVDHVLVFVR
jgi:hypothetical protein